jgi:two-component system chemotaxis response regulator CheY
MRILVVEDDYISRRLLCRYLDSYGVCEEAVNGNEAVDVVRRAISANEYFGLICLDIMMPGMDGQQTLVAIREMEAENGMPLGCGAKVVMTSALEDDQSIMKALNASADGYVAKPIEKRRFIETLKETGLLMEPAPSQS